MVTKNPYAGLKIGETILKYKDDNPSSSCEEISSFIHKHFPGCRTNPLSVACTLQKSGRATGRVVRSKKEEDLPTFDPLAEPEPEAEEETEEQARHRINVRYEAMERMAVRVVDGRMPSLIISGPPGVGKSWTVTEALRASSRQRHDGLTNVGGGGPMEIDGFISTGWYDHIGGGCTPVGLYHAMWNMRNGGVIFLDDCDGVFRDEESLNLLKVATDSTRERLVSWRKNASWLDEFEIDKTFDFKGHIIFLTNIDFEEAIRRGHRDSEHLKALIDRAAYLCLTLRTARDFMIRIKDVAGGKDGFLVKSNGLTLKQSEELLDFVSENQKRFHNLSLRLVGQIAINMKDDPANWKRDTEATKMRTI